MTPDTRDELILKHLDGDTSAEESAQVKRLLSEDTSFRSRFFSFVNQVAGLRMKLDTTPKAEAHPGRNGNTPPAPAAAPRPALGDAQAGQGSGIDYRQIYFNAVLGGIGGLAGWMIFNLLVMLLPGISEWSVWGQHFLDGPIYGICIGFAIGCTEGLIASRSLKRMLHGGQYGALLGALGGFIGLMLGEWIFTRELLPSIWSRAIGWAIFGAFVGTSDGFAQKMPAKVRYGVLGGILGGLIGGGTYQGLVSLLYGISPAVALSWGSAIGLILLGACIGTLVGLVESLLRKSWVFFITGRLEGQTRTLESNRPHTLGSDVGCDIVLPNDPTVSPVHAEIAWVDEQFVVRPRDGQVVVRREGKDLKGTSHALQPGDRVQLGDTKMIFRNVEGKKKP